MTIHKTNNWKVWSDFCLYNDEDPYETIELSFDRGGGNSDDFEYTGDIPEREED